MESKQPTEEGPRSFAHFLQLLGSGQAHADLSADLHRLATSVRDESKRSGKTKGTMTVQIELRCEDGKTVDAVYGVKLKEPPRKTPKSVFWITKGGNLTPENPAQQSLNLREVKGGSQEVRDVGDVAMREV